MVVPLTILAVMVGQHSPDFGIGWSLALERITGCILEESIENRLCWDHARKLPWIWLVCRMVVMMSRSGMGLTLIYWTWRKFHSSWIILNIWLDFSASSPHRVVNFSLFSRRKVSFFRYCVYDFKFSHLLPCPLSLFLLSNVLDHSIFYSNFFLLAFSAWHDFMVLIGAISVFFYMFIQFACYLPFSPVFLFP